MSNSGMCGLAELQGQPVAVMRIASNDEHQPRAKEMVLMQTVYQSVSYASVAAKKDSAKHSNKKAETGWYCMTLKLRYLMRLTANGYKAADRREDPTLLPVG